MANEELMPINTLPYNIVSFFVQERLPVIVNLPKIRTDKCIDPDVMCQQKIKIIWWTRQNILLKTVSVSVFVY